MLRIYNFKNPVNLGKCQTQWTGDNLFGPVFHFQDSTRKQTRTIFSQCAQKKF